MHVVSTASAGGASVDGAKLYAVYLGGDLAAGRMGEDHEVIHVVAPDVREARRLAKQKWRGSGRPHVDAVLHLDVVEVSTWCSREAAAPPRPWWTPPTIRHELVLSDRRAD